MNILAALQGKKTYIATAAGVIGSVAAVASGAVTPVNGALAAIVLIAQALTRAGSKADANKVIAEVGSTAQIAAAVAPVVGALVPSAAKAAAIAGELATEIGSASAAAAAPAA